MLDRVDRVGRGSVRCPNRLIVGGVVRSSIVGCFRGIIAYHFDGPFKVGRSVNADSGGIGVSYADFIAVLEPPQLLKALCKLK